MDEKNESWRESNREAFEALQRLKKRTFLYDSKNKTEHEAFNAILQNRELIESALLCDDCGLMINQTYGVAGIVGLSSEPNMLRKKFDAEEMRTYIALLQLYLDKDVAAGSTHVVDCSYNDFQLKIRDISDDPGMIGRNGLYGSIKAIEKRLVPFAGYSMIRLNQKDRRIEIYPGIMFCMDRETLEERCRDIIDPWLEKRSEEENRQEKKPPKSDEDGASAMQLSLFDDNPPGKGE